MKCIAATKYMGILWVPTFPIPDSLLASPMLPCAVLCSTQYKATITSTSQQQKYVMIIIKTMFISINNSIFAICRNSVSMYYTFSLTLKLHHITISSFFFYFVASYPPTMLNDHFIFWEIKKYATEKMYDKYM